MNLLKPPDTKDVNSIIRLNIPMKLCTGEFVCFVSNCYLCFLDKSYKRLS